ncbi:MAG: hypothetical protein A2087_05490 [Spirochaetes bacterium GWD1_61_31]|nr:MAG: hypothetical protein A2Y37_03700 [Spirochaetes bacterium GWB1_60_80]OHD35093.1 MAG: hypothetical protein A2004_05235 [Spirochaetes bacterium GWC1_61_12]OHD43610.1 MAG: hypothetical protein A2087_05490 [Spirochaetes bacterium GWD1_61_31]OHD44102.1 MAG: hypothetical protein A2Y35_01915 [Spirochaetes bacterium GWE1_60_18]OHD61857.1 MAG: hypothetical protein A2Y32_13960 [Spirochaetes bacterium GWF1_60_12]HAW85076.1 hypothetical protein [Spirochaetaceae bacterium]
MKLRKPLLALFLFSVIVLILGGLMLAAIPLRQAVRQQAAAILDAWLSDLVGQLPLVYSYHSISPGILDSVIVNDLAITLLGGVDIAVPRLILHYSWQEIVGKNYHTALQAVILEQPVVTIRPEALSVPDGDPAALIALLTNLFTEPASPLRIDLRNAELHVAAGTDFALDIRLRRLEAEWSRGQLLYRSDGHLELASAQSLSTLGVLKAGFMVDGAASLEDFSSTFTLQCLVESALATIRPVSCQGCISADGLQLRLDPQSRLARLDLELDFRAGLLAVAASFDTLRPDSVVELMPAYQSLQDWARTAYSGEIGAQCGFGSAGLDIDSARFNLRLAGTVPVAVPGGRVRMEAELYGSPAAITIVSARLWNPVYAVSYRGLIRPRSLGFDGQLGLSYTPDALPKIEAVFSLLAENGYFFAYGERIDIFSGSLQEVVVSLTIDKSEILFALDAFLPALGKASLAENSAPAAPVTDEPTGLQTFVLDPLADGHVQVLAPYRPSLRLEGSLQLGEDPYLSVRSFFDSFYPMAFFQDQVPGLNPLLRDLLSRMRITTDLNIFTNFSGISYYANNAILAMDGFNSLFAVVSLTGNADSLLISKLNASLGSYALQGTADLSFPGFESLAVDIDIAINDIPYTLNASLLDGNLFVTGDYGLQLRIQTYNGITSGVFSAENLPLEIGQQIYTLSTDLSARFASTDEWTADFSRLTALLPTGPGQEQFQLNLTGSMNQSGLDLATVELLSNSPTLVGQGSFDWHMADGLAITGNVELGNENGENYSLMAEYGDGSMTGALGMRKARLARLLPTLSGLLDADARIDGRFPDLAIGLQFSVNPDRQSIGTSLFARGSASYQAGRIALSDGELEYGNLKLMQLSGEFDIPSSRGTFGLDARIALLRASSVPTFTARVAGQAAVNLSAGDDQSAPASVERGDILAMLRLVSELDFKTGRLSGQATNFKLQGNQKPDWPYQIAFNPEGWQIQAGPATEVAINWRVSGELNAWLAPKLPMAGQLTGTIRDQMVDLQATGLQISMPFVFQLIEIPVVSIVSGTARGNATIRGSQADPEMFGSFDFNEFYLRVDNFVVDTIGPITETLYIEGKQAELNQSDLDCGTALLDLQLILGLDSWIPNDIQINVASVDLTQIHTKTRLLGMAIDAYATTDLGIRIMPTGAVVDGIINAESGDLVITLDILNQRASTDVVYYDIVTNLRFNIGNGLRIFFPDKSRPFFSGQTDPQSELSVYYDSMQSDLSITGNIIIRGGNVFYIKRNFYLKAANMVFNENSDSFNPLLTLQAETRSSYNGEPVVIRLRADNAPLKNLVFSLESTPALTEAEIARLLGQDLLANDENREITGLALLENLDFIIPQLNIISIFEQNVQNLLGLDLFYLRSQILQRWLYDLTGLNASGQPMTMADYLDNTAIIAGKYLTDNLFIQSTILLQEGQLEMQGNLQLNYELSLEWQTPHFLINWSFRPEHPENWFISDQALTLSWRIPLK